MREHRDGNAGDNRVGEQFRRGRRGRPGEWHTTQNSKLVTVNPNPTTDHIRLDLTDFAGEAVTISIFEEQGQLVWENRIPAVEDLQLHISLREAGAAAGMYTIRVHSTSGSVATRVVVVD
ncbi:MAG: T9SS type A sorting domain-containing protein [Lewinellaceae bacterium]|nr:T9SS type A sorting domain-containing protein [Lewinellaceae bacterium]